MTAVSQSRFRVAMMEPRKRKDESAWAQGGIRHTTRVKGMGQSDTFRTYQASKSNLTK